MRSRNQIVSALALGLSISIAARAESVEDRLHEAVYQEETVGDLEAAIKMYRQIAMAEKVDRSQEAQAIFGLGRCFLKMGQKQQAIKTFEQLIAEFPKELTLVKRAHGALALLGHERSSDSAAATLSRTVASFPPETFNTKSWAISADSRHFVFQDAESSSLVVRDLDTGLNRQLVPIAMPLEMQTLRTAWQSVAISRDGKWVAFNLYDEKDSSAELRIIGIDGSQLRTVFQPRDTVRWFAPRDWSPDGKQIVGRLSQTDGTGRIVIMSVADGTFKELKMLDKGDSEYMRLSPDGRYLAYDFAVGNSEQFDIALMPVDGGPEVSVVEHPADDNLMGWSPDGRTLLFCSNRKNSYSAWAIQIIDGRPQGIPQLVKERTDEADPLLNGRVTRDGKFYYSARKPDGYRQSVYMATIDPVSGELLTPAQQYSESMHLRAISPEFSPDGQFLAYYVSPTPVRSDRGVRYGPGNIIVRSLETGQEREIKLSPRFSDGGYWPRIRWNPDGRSLLVRGRSEVGRSGLFQVDLATGKLDAFVLGVERKETSDWQLMDYDQTKGDYVSFGEYSPDAKAVYYVRSDWQPNDVRSDRHIDLRVMRRDLATGRETEICRNPEGKVGFGNIAVSPDGKRLLIGAKSGLWIVPTTGGVPRELLKLQSPAEVFNHREGFSGRIKWRFTWTQDSRHLLFLKAGQQSPELWRIAVDGGQLELLDTLSANLGRGPRSVYSTQELRIHPDGRRIAFVATTLPEVELRVLEDFLPELTPVRLLNPPTGNYFVTRSEDDAEEYGNGSVNVAGSDLDLGQMDLGNAENTIAVGIRFDKIHVPEGARIKRAYLQFTKDDTDVESEPSVLTIHAELSGNAQSFTDDKYSISSRKKTRAEVTWKPEPWKLGWERSEKHQSPDLTSLVREVVVQDNWNNGGSLVMIITGTGERDTISFDGGGRRYGPMLHIELE